MAEDASAEPAIGIAALPPIHLKTVRTSGSSTWSREEIYDDDARLLDR
jgi:hypothetical protein